MNSRLWERKIEKHEIQKIGCNILLPLLVMFS